MGIPFLVVGYPSTFFHLQCLCIALRLHVPPPLEATPTVASQSFGSRNLRPTDTTRLYGFVPKIGAKWTPKWFVINVKSAIVFWRVNDVRVSFQHDPGHSESYHSAAFPKSKMKASCRPKRLNCGVKAVSFTFRVSYGFKVVAPIWSKLQCLQGFPEPLNGNFRYIHNLHKYNKYHV